MAYENICVPGTHTHTPRRTYDIYDYMIKFVIVSSITYDNVVKIKYNRFSLFFKIFISFRVCLKWSSELGIAQLEQSVAAPFTIEEFLKGYFILLLRIPF